MTGATLTLRPAEAVNLHGQETGREHLSYSSLGTFLACHRKYSLDKVERLSLIARPRYFDMGSAFQKAIELQDAKVGPRMLRGWVPCETCRGLGEHGPGTFEDPIIDCEACEGNGGEQGDAPRIASQEDEDRLRVEETIVECAAALYLRRWPADDRQTREYPYRVRLRNPATGHYSRTFDLLGYADGVEDCGSYFELVENKLVGQVTAVAVKRLPLDRQLALERYGLWRATAKAVRRVKYRWVRKPSIKQREGRKKDKSDAESIDEFLQRLTADYVERGDGFYSHEETFFVDPADTLRVEAELWEWAEQLRSQRRRQFFDRNTSHCTDYGGCQFIPICTGDPDAGALYQVRPHHDQPKEAAAA